MLRTTVGVSFLVLFGVVSACSSKATDNNGSGGNGTVLTGGTGGTNANTTGGTNANTTGGTNANTTGGTNANTTGGNLGRAGATSSTAGSGNGLCADDTVTCVDDAQAKGCNPATGEVQTIDCVTYYATLGITSTGCSTDAQGAGCDISDFKDAACLAGAEAFAFCANASDQDLVGVYIDCFQDYMGSHSLVTCLGDYVSPTMMTAADCQNAVDACLEGAGGAGGAGSGPGDGDGAGGAP